MSLIDLDRKYGFEKEKEFYETLKKYFNEENLNFTNKNNSFDFESENILIELKSRRCYSHTYPDTMIGYNKIKKASQISNKKVVFVFNFLDGLFYWIYNKETDLKIKKAGRIDRGLYEKNDYCFIPIKNLEPLIIEDEYNIS